jgi:hypothetical protein
VETSVSQSAVSKASLAVVGIVGGRGPEGPEPWKGLPKEVAGLGVFGLLLQFVHHNAKSGFRDRGLVLLRQVQLALLLWTRASVVLTQGLELGPLLGKLLRETALRRNGAGDSGLLVLGAGRRREGDLTPLECLLEAVELRKNEFAVAAVLGACVLRLRVCARVGSSAAACEGRRRGLCCCRLIGAVVEMQEVLVQTL